MCNNKEYTDAQKERIEKMTQYAKAVLLGSSIETVAKEKCTTVEEVKAVLRDIQNINPGLYMQVKEKVNI